MSAPLAYCPVPPPPRASYFPVPEGSCDSHAHVFGPVSRYPYTADRHYRPAERAYVPPAVDIEDYAAHLAALRLQHGVLVQPNVYGTDQRCLVDALAHLKGRARGIAVLPLSVDDAELRRLHQAGVRGVRFHGLAANELDALRAFAARISALDWHIQIYAPLAWVAANAEYLHTLPCPVVLDHFAGLKTASPVISDEFCKVIRLVKDGPGWVKLSGGFRATTSPMPYEVLAPHARALADVAPHRLVWGSDWPYTRVAQPLPRGGDLLEVLSGWIKSPALLTAILRDNPRALYGFDD